MHNSKSPHSFVLRQITNDNKKQSSSIDGLQKRLPAQFLQPVTGNNKLVCCLGFRPLSTTSALASCMSSIILLGLDLSINQDFTQMSLNI